MTNDTSVEGELRTANLAAETRLALLTALLDAISVGVILINRELVVAQWNKEATRLTGIPADSVLGQPASVLGEAIAQRVEDFPFVRAHLQEAFGATAISEFPITILEPRREIDVTVSPAVLPTDGAHVGSVIVLHDSHRHGESRTEDPTRQPCGIHGTNARAHIL